MYDITLINGLCCIKYAYSLNALLPASPGENNCKFPKRCPTKKRHKNNPVNAIQYFLAIEDFNKTDLLIDINICKICSKFNSYSQQITI